jgi:hypothetical protein
MLIGGPGPNRIPMKLTTLMYLGGAGAVFVNDTLTVRAYASARSSEGYTSNPPDALWVF